MAVTQLIYSSRNQSVDEGSAWQEMLRSILAVSQRNNLRDGLTGFLIFDHVHFFQILEGESDRVRAAYSRIQKDPRHAEVTLIGEREIRARSFPQWSMASAVRSSDQQEIFVRHGVPDSLDPATIVAPTILALAMDLQDFQLSHAQALRAS